jgi:hypothetical protein
MSAWGKKDDTTSDGTVTLTAPSITFNGATAHAAGVYTSAAHPFQLGDPVAYSDGGGTQVVGLTDGDTYFVTNVTTDTFSVAATEAGALHNNPTIIASTDGSGASHTFTLSLNYGRGTLTGTSTNFIPELSVGDTVRVGNQEMIAIAVASDTVATVINANPVTTLTAFSGEGFTISQKPKSIASDSNTLSSNVFGVDTTEIGSGGDNVTSVALIQGGARYLEVPAVTFSGGGGASAAATASIAGGLVTAVTVTNVGSSYETVPTVAIAKPRRVIPTGSVTIATEQIAYATHGLVAAESVKYFKVGAGTAITGLVDDTEYFVSALGLAAGTFRLAASAAAAAGRTALAGVVIAGTGGEFTCTATTLAAGDRIRITGTLGGTGTITDYTTGTIYTVSAVTGTSPSVTGFTLTTDAGSAITTTAGTPTGLTYTPFTIVLISGTGNSAQYFEIQATADQATATAAKGTGETGTSASHVGWVKRTVGTGARAGRIQYEVLCALSKNGITSDAADDIQFPD